MNSLLERLRGGVKSPKVLLIIGLAGILLIGLSSVFPAGKGTENNKTQEFSAQEYCIELEEKIEKIVTDITGDKSPTVVVTLGSGIRYSYADSIEADSSSQTGEKTEQKSESSNKTYITVKASDGGEEPLVITCLMPEIRGVAVICNGGDNEANREKIENAVTAALNITSKRVFITGGATYEKG
ncbi:MAG: hypothetical protein IJZ75_00105 [Clostridia bacterium]|nr:hypothetical protein [Clostridia bacterium]